MPMSTSCQCFPSHAHCVNCVCHGMHVTFELLHWFDGIRASLASVNSTEFHNSPFVRTHAHVCHCVCLHLFMWTCNVCFFPTFFSFISFNSTPVQSIAFNSLTSCAFSVSIASLNSVNNALFMCAASLPASGNCNCNLQRLTDNNYGFAIE